MTQATFNLYETMLCNRCGISTSYEMHQLLDELPTTGNKLEKAYEIATEMFKDTIHSRLANSPIDEKTAVSKVFSSADFNGYCELCGLHHLSARYLYAFIVVVYGDGCSPEDAVLNMTEDEVLELCKDPSVYHFVINLFKHNATNETCREYIRVLLSHLPKQERTKENLAYIVRHGIH